MNTSASYDVFISYRRESGSQMARLLREALEKRGYRVFLDVEDLKEGHFDEALLREIERIPSFLVVLSPGCLDRCSNRGDWLRVEIAHAIRTQRKIIPVTLPGFVFPEVASLPEELNALPRHQAVEHTHRYFDAEVITLCQYLGPPLSGVARDTNNVAERQARARASAQTTAPAPRGAGCLVQLKRLASVSLILAIVAGSVYVTIRHGMRESKFNHSVPYIRDGWEAPFMYRKALDGDPEAQYQLAEEYRLGSYALIQNEAEAAKWYEKAAHAGNAEAQYRLAVLYRDGVGMISDKKQALYWMNESVKRGHLQAQYELGVAYLEGRWVDRDTAEGERLLWELATQHYGPAEDYLTGR